MAEYQATKGMRQFNIDVTAIAQTAYVLTAWIGKSTLSYTGI